jgi:hypothetical protein
MFWGLFFLALQFTTSLSSECVCTTVPCPVEGNNTVIMGNGNANIEYVYAIHNNHEVVISASGTISPGSLDHGTETTSCTQKYSRMLEDDGNQNCDAGHILANRLGGYGNTPINIFPQNASSNRGPYAQFEGNIYDCMKTGASIGYLSWVFYYESVDHTQPYSVLYNANFEGGTCKSLRSQFENS